MTRRPAGARADEGQVSLLIVGFAVIAILLVVVVVDASAAYLHRQRLDALADGAALAAVDGIQAERVYESGLDERLALDPAAVRGLVAAYLQGTGAHGRYAGLRYQVTTSSDSVSVRMSAPLELPLAPAGWADATLVSTGSAAFTQVVD